jgi:signal transduction histidine kinase
MLHTPAHRDGPVPHGSGSVGSAIRRNPGIQVAIVLGFASVFGLWLLWGFQLLRSLRDVERNISAVHESQSRGEQALVRIRTNVLLGSIHLRDALIDTGSSGRDYYRREITRLRDEVELLLRDHMPDASSPVERSHWARLQVELGEYWASREIAFATGTESPPPDLAGTILRSRVVPRRNTILEVLDQLGALQAASTQRYRDRAEVLYGQTRARLVSVGAVALVVALLVAVFASRYVNRLQRHIERQHRSEQDNRQDLERLSARLVDAQEDERRHLARELHDEVGQALTAVKMDIGLALRANIEPRVRSALEEAKEITDSTLQGIRDLSQLLHPSMLDDFGLPATLAAHLRGFSQRTGIRAQLGEMITGRMAAPVEVCIYRIVQEALNNVARHSGASACTVSLSAGDAWIRVIVEDNGRGFGPTSVVGSASPRRGLGLIGMRERAQALGGTFAVESPAGGGTRIIAIVPAEPAIEADQDDSQQATG